MTLAVTPSTVAGHRPLSGPDKVAALLLAMGKPLASRLIKHFDPAELKVITRAAAALGPVPRDALGPLVEELAADFTRGIDLQGGAAEVELLLGEAFPPDQVADIMAEVKGNSNASTWVRLSALPEKDLAAYVGREHLQTAALILSRLTPEAAAKTLAALSPDQRKLLIRRMLGLRPVSEPALRLLETKLRDDLLTGAPGRGKEVNTRSRMADILNRMDPEEAEALLGAIAETRPADAAALRSKMFSFADVATLSVKARSVLFDKVPAEQVVFSLKGMEEAFREVVLSALGARARRLVENELKSDPGSQKEVAMARKAIAGTVLDLIARGEIEPPAPPAAAA